jgi:hypothetical protein
LHSKKTEIEPTFGGFSTTEEILSIFWNPKVHNHVHNSPYPEPDGCSSDPPILFLYD